MSYVQVFNLLPESGSYYVQNDVFRRMSCPIRMLPIFLTDS